MERIEFENEQEYAVETFEILEYMQENRLDLKEVNRLEDGRVVVLMEGIE